MSARTVEVARDALGDHFRAEVRVLPAEKLPNEAYYPPRKRYRAEKLLEHLMETPTTRVVGLTAVDVSTSMPGRKDWGVFGLSWLGSKPCVVSTFRMGRREDRLRKVVVHEVGHTLGLAHCPTDRCLMQDARGKASTVDREREAFCAPCRAKIADWLKA